MRFTHYKGYGIHSPFIFNLVMDVVECKHPFYAFEALKEQRKRSSHAPHRLTNFEAQKMLRLLNALNPNRIVEVNTDTFDNQVLSHTGKMCRAFQHDIELKDGDLCFIAHKYNTKSLHDKLKQSNKVTLMVKHPNGINKEMWRQLYGSYGFNTGVMFYGFGVLLSNTELPKRMFRILY